MNPYSDANFFTFFSVLFTRFSSWLRGDFASDEVQLLVLSLIAVASALVGSFLVLKRMAMLANAISHTVLLGIVLAYVLARTFAVSPSGEVNLPILLIASLATALITAFLTQALTYGAKLQEDASIGLTFTTLFALGVVGVSVLTHNVHIGIEAVMGNVDALHPRDAILSAYVLFGDLFILMLFFKQLHIVAFDPLLARSQGINTTCFHTLILVLTAATAIGAFRAVGVLLVLAFLVGPVLTARLFTNNVKNLMIFSSLIGVGCSFFSVALSRHLLSAADMAVSTGGLVVTLIGLTYLSSLFVKWLKS